MHFSLKFSIKPLYYSAKALTIRTLNNFVYYSNAKCNLFSTGTVTFLPVPVYIICAKNDIK